MSEGGVFIATYRVQPVGTPLRLAFELPCGTKVTARGEVRWIREGDGDSNDGRPGMGIAFTSLPEAALLAIGRFCRQRPPLYMEFRPIPFLSHVPGQGRARAYCQRAKNVHHGAR